MAVFCKGHVPEWFLGPHIALHQLHVLEVQVVGRGILEAVPDEGVNMLNDLRRRGVVNPKAFGHERAANQLARKMLLDAGLGQRCLQDRAHDVLHVFSC